MTDLRLLVVNRGDAQLEIMVRDIPDLCQRVGLLANLIPVPATWTVRPPHQHHKRSDTMAASQSTRSRGATKAAGATKAGTTTRRRTNTPPPAEPEAAPPSSSNGSDPGVIATREKRFIFDGVATEDLPSVHILQAKILDELPPIPKDGYNQQQDFHFRGIDDTIVALNPLLAKYGVRIMPHRIRELQYSTRTSSRGNPVYTTNIIVIFRWYGPGGDYIEAEGIGEGTDSLDKDASKAIQMAYKYMIFQALAIATRDASNIDADHGPTTETIHPTLAALIARHDALPGDLRDKVRLQIIDKVWNGQDAQMEWTPEAAWELYETLVNLGEKRVAERAADYFRQAQDADATAPQAAPSTPATTTGAGRPATQTPATGPVVDTPPEPSPEPDPTPQTPTEPAQDEPPTDAPSDDAEAVTWDQVEDMSEKDLRDGIKAAGGEAARSATREQLAETYWVLLGGTFESDPGDGFQCPECNAFPFETQDELDAHMATDHGDGSAEDPGAADPTPVDAATSDWEAKPVDPETLKVVENEVGNLRGVAARTYATYRRQQGLPSALKDLTMGQAMALMEFFERLPSA